MKQSQTILIIDDNSDDRELCRRALADTLSPAPEFLEAGSGDTGLQLMEVQMPDCVLLDYSLPKHNGIEVLKKLRAQHSFVPVVMMTGQGNEAVAVTAMQEGAQSYIAKSAITPETLEQALRGAIEHCSLEKRIHDQRVSLEIFTRALAHDLKEPIRTIRAFIDLMEKYKDAPEKRDMYFRHVREASDRMAMLIQTVSMYIQLDAPEQGNARESCDMNRALQEARDNLDILIREHQATVLSEILPNVLANRVHMFQVLQNLIANAIRHSDKPVTVHVGAIQRGDDWVFSVRDNGPGIAPENREKIFSPFKRLTRNDEGAGLGLAICRKIVESHGGTIWCESSEGQGATFCFALPRVGSVVH